MAIRMSGMISGLDTESLVKELVSAQKLKNKKYSDKLTLSQWKEDKWKELNTKLYKLYTEDISKLRLSGNYTAKKVTTTNDNLVSVTGDSTSSSGTYTISDIKTASSHYITSGIITNGSDKVKGATTLSDLMSSLGTTLGTSESISFDLSGGVNKSVTVTGSTTLTALASQLKSAGINASYDEAQGRFFLGSTTTGESSQFTIAAGPETNAAAVFNALKLNEGVVSSSEVKLGSDKAVGSTKLSDLVGGFASGTPNLEIKVGDAAVTVTEVTTITDFVNQLSSQGLNVSYDESLGKLSISNNSSKELSIEAGSDAYTSSILSALHLNSADAIDKSKVAVVEGKDSSVVLNGVTLTGTSNTIAANGLTINLKGNTTSSESINVSVTNDTDTTYKKVKDFINNYNTILKEMNTLYYADSASDYAPLSDDEKAGMSDEQIEKWETKIKDSILRRDDTMGSLISAMKTAMTSKVNVSGTYLSLANYGIQTSKDYTEKGLLHIAGDSDDAEYSTSTNKLKKALENDPDTVIAALSGVVKNLYDTMTSKMSSIKNVRSVFTFYNDKQMDSEQVTMKKKITELENKLTDMEDRYYKQFTAMEKAMANMQSQSNALTGLLGTS